MKTADRPHVQLARRVKRLAHLDLPGAGQVTVSGRHAYVGHLPNRERLSTTIVDIADPCNPRVVARVMLEDGQSHSHKVRVKGDLMIVNHERNNDGTGRKGEQLPGVRRNLRELLGREPILAEIAEKMALSETDIRRLEEMENQPYELGGVRLYDVSDPARPRMIQHLRTGGIGVHRFDMDENYAYLSTEMKGFLGNILVIYDIRNPERPVEVSRWWTPGQHIDGGERPSWAGRQHRLHHALRFGNELWASMWHGGVRIIDIADITKPKTVASYNYHPPIPEPTHSFMPVPTTLSGRRIAVAIDEEDQFYNAAEAEKRRGRLHSCMWTFDVSDYAKLQPLAAFTVSELDSPWSRVAGARFGAHQFVEFMDDTLVYATWFSGGLRIIDVADPMSPQEVGFFIPEPADGYPAPQSNDVTLDDRGLIYLVDRYVGFDILEFER
jgi:hypothetical protein